MHKSAWMLVGAIAALPLVPVQAADLDPLRPDAQQRSWARWQGRLSLVTAADPWKLGFERPGATLRSASLMGDYYLSRSLGGPNGIGGLRATSGLLFGPRASLAAEGAALGGLPSGNGFSIGSRAITRPAALASNDLSSSDHTTTPYVGIGYTGLSPRSGWGFSADLGLIAKSATGASRTVGGPTLDELIRDMRMTPLLQLGVSYAF